MEWIKASDIMPSKDWEGVARSISSFGRRCYHHAKYDAVESLRNSKISTQVEWLDESADDKAEIDRLKGLIETMYYACSRVGQKLTDAGWQQFKTDNQL